jgi:hypothetical protein
MAWVNPLDKTPQIPVDWANHISQGGLGSMVFMLLFAFALFLWHGNLTPVTVQHAVAAGFLLTTVISVGKKAVDYVKEHETVQMCVGKALVTVIWPASLLGLVALLRAVS